MREMPSVHIDQNRCSHKTESAGWGQIIPHFAADKVTLVRQLARWLVVDLVLLLTGSTL